MAELAGLPEVMRKGRQIDAGNIDSDPADRAISACVDYR